MKKVLTLVAAVLVFGASASFAQGLNLYWNDCQSGVTNFANTCATASGSTMSMHASVFPPSMPMFAATTTVVDIAVADATLPAWWLTNAGQCRANAIGISYDPNNNPGTCPDLWQFNQNLQVSQIQQGVNGPNRIRVNGVAAVPAGSELNVVGGSEQWVCRVTITRTNQLTCAGCLTPATIVLNEMYMQQPGGLPAYRITNPADNYCIGYNGGDAQCPGATPTQNATWGAVKNLYR